MALKNCLDISTLGRFAPRKEKFVRGNNTIFINRNLKKAHIKINNMRNWFLKNYFTLKEKDVRENKKIWRAVILLSLSDKIKSTEKISLFEEDKIISEYTGIHKHIEQFFL